VKTMRTYGTGTVDQLPSERWRARLILPGGVRRSLGTFATQAEAAAVANAATRQVAQRNKAAAPVVGSTLTLADWGKPWLDQRELDGIRGIAQERSLWRAHIVPRLGALVLREITRPQVVRWLGALRQSKAQVSTRGGSVGAHTASDRTLSRQVVVHALRVLRAALRAARDAGHLHADPTDGVTVPRGREGRAEDAWTYLSADEVEALVRCEAIPDPWRALYTVAAYSGLRRGELWALRWEDVSVGEVPELTVRASHSGPTKSGRVRRVPLLPPAIEALGRIRPTTPSPPTGLVFPVEGGGQRGTHDDGRWAPARRAGGLINGYRTRAGIVRHVRFHDLRHTCASHLVMGTWGPTLSLHEAAQWLGHTSVAVTQRYAHLCPDRLAARVAASTPQGPANAQGPRPLSGQGSKRDQIGTPKSGHAPDAPDHETPCFQAPPARVERATNGLGSRCSIH